MGTLLPYKTLPTGGARKYRDFGLVGERAFVALQLRSNQLLDHQLLRRRQLDALSFPGALAARFGRAKGGYRPG